MTPTLAAWETEPPELAPSTMPLTDAVSVEVSAESAVDGTLMAACSSADWSVPRSPSEQLSLPVPPPQAVKEGAGNAPGEEEVCTMTSSAGPPVVHTLIA